MTRNGQKYITSAHEKAHRMAIKEKQAWYVVPTAYGLRATNLKPCPNMPYRVFYPIPLRSGAWSELIEAERR